MFEHHLRATMWLCGQKHGLGQRGAGSGQENLSVDHFPMLVEYPGIGFLTRATVKSANSAFCGKLTRNCQASGWCVYTVAIRLALERQR